MARRRMTVADLSDECARQGARISERTITRWRTGATAPGIEALPLLARSLQTTTDHLLGMDAGE